MSTDTVYYVYILASLHHGALYVGVTRDLAGTPGATPIRPGIQIRVPVQALPVYAEQFATPEEAIIREKRLKVWKRDWKIKLIEKDNPDWRDLSGLL